jgi:hypothetical protein
MKIVTKIRNAELRIVLLLFFVVWPATLCAQNEKSGDLHVTGPATVQTGQAFFLRVEASQGLKALQITWQGRSLKPKLADAGKNVIPVMLGVGLNVAAGAHDVVVTGVGASGSPVEVKHSVQVKKKDYPEQRLTVKRKYTELSKPQLDRHYAEKKEVGAVLGAAEGDRYLRCPMVWPVEGPITSVYGLRRFFNDQPRKPHSGVDIAAASGTPVKAFAPGLVVLADDHYFAGKSIYIDHGQGVVSMYFHLSSIDAEVGRFVSAGDVIGKIGKTGRVTGAHLHFGLSVLGKTVDPLPLLENPCPAELGGVQ